MSIRPPVNYFGGKWYLKYWIISHFPINYESMNYLEPFLGGGNILLNKKENVREIANDINPNLFYLWTNIQANNTFLMDCLSKINYNEKNFEFHKNLTPKTVLEQAIKEFVIRRMSRSSMGKTFSWQERLRGGQPGAINSWETAIENLNNVHDRTKKVIFYNKPAIELLQKYDDRNLLVYLDPPYLHETRKSKSVYQFEMLEKDHRELLNTILNMKAKILISGYNSKLYSNYLDKSGWNRTEKIIPNHSGQNKLKEIRTEVLWRNY